MMEDRNVSSEGPEAAWNPSFVPLPPQEHPRLSLKRLGLAAAGTLLAVFVFVALFSSPAETEQERLLASLSAASGPNASSSSSPPPTAGANQATLSVESRPDGAVVLIDGNAIGITPINSYILAADAYLLSLRLSGYLPLDTVIVLEEGQAPSFSFVLTGRYEMPAGEPSDLLAAPGQDPSDEPEQLASRDAGAAALASEQPAGNERAQAEPPGAQAAPEEDAPEEDPGNALSSPEVRATYEEHLSRGNELFLQERYLDARLAYEQALAARPDDERAAERIERIDALLAEAERAAQQHQYHRGRGDVFFEQGNFEEAARSYKEALAYQPDDAYVQDRLAQSLQQMETRQAEEQRQANMVNSEGVYVAVDQRPTLIGSLAALHRRVNYPREAYERGIEGRVVVQMVVDAEGRVRDPEVIKGIGGGCDEEALRVVRSARFEPALVDGQPVPALHAIWIQFDISEDGDA